MKVIVDTDVWSEALRKGGNKPSAAVRELGELIENGRVQMVGLIRMEMLCGVRGEKRFEKLKQAMAAFPDRALDAEVFKTAAAVPRTSKAQWPISFYAPAPSCGACPS